MLACEPGALVLFASGRQGWADTSLEGPRKDLSAMFDLILSLRDQGITILLVEQNAFMALEYSSLAYVIERGVVSPQRESAALLHDDGIKAAYLGG